MGVRSSKAPRSAGIQKRSQESRVSRPDECATDWRSMNTEEPESTDDKLVRARGEDGGLVPEGAQVPVTIKQRRMKGERKYMAQVAETFDDSDFEGLAKRIIEDAMGESDADAKVVNAAREWLRKVALGDGRLSIEDLDYPPAIVKRR